MLLLPPFDFLGLVASRPEKVHVLDAFVETPTVVLPFRVILSDEDHPSPHPFSLNRVRVASCRIAEEC